MLCCKKGPVAEIPALSRVDLSLKSSNGVSLGHESGMACVRFFPIGLPFLWTRFGGFDKPPFLCLFLCVR